MVTRSVPVPSSSTASPVDLLILGAGWTSTFLIPLLKSEQISFAATSTSGRDGTIPFVFEPSSDSPEPYKSLPDARTVLITFPLKGEGQSKLLVKSYEESRSGSSAASGGRRLFIQLGSTGIFSAPHWNTSSSSYDKSNARAVAEDELLSLSSAPHLITSASGKTIESTVLNLAGLWGGARQPRNWLGRVIKKRSDLEGKKALHLVHGADVSQAILGAHLSPKAVSGRRWIVCDLHVYDWWDLTVQWATEEENLPQYERQGLRAFEVQVEGDEAGIERLDLQAEVFRCLEKSGVRALPEILIH